MNIFVTNMDREIDSDQLKNLFEQFGTVEFAKVIMDRDTGVSRGFGFVEMPDDGDGQTAIENLNDLDINGRAIMVKKARPREERSNGDHRGDFNRSRGSRNGGGNDNDGRGFQRPDKESRGPQSHEHSDDRGHNNNKKANSKNDKGRGRDDRKKRGGRHKENRPDKENRWK